MAYVNTKGMSENEKFVARFEAAMKQARSGKPKDQWGEMNLKDSAIPQGPISKSELRLAEKRLEKGGRIWFCENCNRLVFLVARDDTAFKHVRKDRDIVCGRSAWDMRVAVAGIPYNG